MMNIFYFYPVAHTFAQPDLFFIYFPSENRQRYRQRIKLSSYKIDKSSLCPQFELEL